MAEKVSPTATNEQQVQQINVVDDTTLQTILSSMNDSEMNTFLDELNKTGKACKNKSFHIIYSRIIDLDLPSIGQTIELLTVSTSTDTAAATTTDAAFQELTTLLQQPPADMVSIGMESKSSTSFNSTVPRQTRTANTYGGTSVGGGGSNRPGTAVKSTISSNNNATIRKPVHQQQTVLDDRMFFGRAATTSQGQQRRPISWFQ